MGKVPKVDEKHFLTLPPHSQKHNFPVAKCFCVEGSDCETLWDNVDDSLHLPSVWGRVFHRGVQNNGKSHRDFLSYSVAGFFTFRDKWGENAKICRRTYCSLCRRNNKFQKALESSAGKAFFADDTL